MTTNNYIAKLKLRLDQAIIQREHWKQIAEGRNSIIVCEVCPDSRSTEEYIIDADSVRASWRLIRGYREQVEALRLQNAMFVTAAVNVSREREALHADAEALENQRAEQWRLRRDAEARCETQAAVIAQLKAEAEAMRAENAKLRTALAEQGERQEAVAWRVSISGMWQYFNTQAEAQAEYDQCHAGDQDYAEYSPEPLYTSPQPAPDVSALVEALEGMLEYFPEGASDGECFAVDAARTALADHRQAQQDSSN